MLYLLGYLLGHFFIMISFSIVAIVRGKNEGAWVWYVIGSAFQLLPLIGDQITAHMYGGNITVLWVAYFFILIVTAAIVRKRRSKAKRKQDIAYEIYRGHRETLWACKKCGASNTPDKDSCQRCGTARKQTEQDTEKVSLDNNEEKPDEHEVLHTTEKQTSEADIVPETKKEPIEEKKETPTITEDGIEIIKPKTIIKNSDQ